MFYNTDGRSYTDTYQVDFNWTPVERLDIFATYRYTNSSMTLDRPDGGRVQVERPLVSRYKALLNIQYATRFRRWTFDATAQLNGPMRLPSQTGDPTVTELSPKYPVFFAQVSRKIKKLDLPRLREHRQLQAGAPDPRCRSSLLHRLQLIGGVGPADGTQVLYRPAVELVLRVFYSADIEPCRQSLQTSL